MSGRLVVYGATGATGRRVATLAAAAGCEPLAMARNAEALASFADPLGIEHRAACLNDLDLTGAAVVVNCAGPYTHFGPPVLAAAIRAGASYVDCTGEPRWVQRIADEFEAGAIAAGVAVVPSLGGGVVTDLAAHHAAAGLGSIHRLIAAIRIIGMHPSPATMRSTVELVAGGAPVAIAGRISWETPGRRKQSFPTGSGALFCSPDAIVLARDFPHALVECHMQPGVAGPALAGMARLWRRPAAARATLSLIDRLPEPGAAGGGRVRATAVADGQYGSRSAIAEVDDIYEVTGRGAFAVARRLLDGAERTGLQPAGAILGDPLAVAPELGVRLSRP